MVSMAKVSTSDLDVDGVKQMSGALTEVTQKADELDQETQVSLLLFILQMSCKIDDD